MKKTDFEIKRYRVLPKKIKAQADKILYNLFFAKLSKKKKAEAKDKYCGKPYAHILVVEKQSVISISQLYKRTIKYKGKRIILGGLGGVCTVKTRRRRGIASTLLKQSIDDLRKQKCEVAFLCTDVKNLKRIKLYGKVGFVIMKQPYTFIGKSGKRYIEKDGMIAPVRSKTKFNLIFKGKKALNIGYGGL